MHFSAAGEALCGAIALIPAPGQPVGCLHCRKITGDPAAAEQVRAHARAARAGRR